MSHLDSKDKGAINELIARIMVLAHDAAIIKTNKNPINVFASLLGHINVFEVRVQHCITYVPDNCTMVPLMHSTVRLYHKSALQDLTEVHKKLEKTIWESMLSTVGNTQ